MKNMVKCFGEEYDLKDTQTLPAQDCAFIRGSDGYARYKAPAAEMGLMGP
jgi:hypothetical protein